MGSGRGLLLGAGNYSMVSRADFFAYSEDGSILGRAEIPEGWVGYGDLTLNGAPPLAARASPEVQIIMLNFMKKNEETMIIV